MILVEKIVLDVFLIGHFLSSSSQINYVIYSFFVK